MTIQELRQSEDYKQTIEKIKRYEKGFTWTMKWQNIPVGKANALKIILSDCIKQGIIKSVSIGYGIDNGLVETEETYERL